ncbi:MAG TPA: hypothetical protein VMT74_13000 [Gaiellaceae bacterium]|nr:hypothetical protein [Gaiellaceae bacterium]
MTGKRLVLAGVALAAAVGLVVAAALGAFASSGRTAAAGAGADGVRVHGHWTIVVRSTSGTVVGRYHFHNDFNGAGFGTSGGADAFSQILSGSNAPGDWDVTLHGSGCPASNGNFCQMFEPDASPGFGAFPPDTKNLTVTAPESGTDAFKIVLQASVTATNDGTIDRVDSGLQKCSSGSAVGHDCGVGYNAVTTRILSSPISVLAGQNISVTVKLSFS